MRASWSCVSFAPQHRVAGAVQNCAASLCSDVSKRGGLAPSLGVTFFPSRSKTGFGGPGLRQEQLCRTWGLCYNAGQRCTEIWSWQQPTEETCSSTGVLMLATRSDAPCCTPQQDARTQAPPHLMLPHQPPAPRRGTATPAPGHQTAPGSPDIPPRPARRRREAGAGPPAPSTARPGARAAQPPPDGATR